MSIADFAVRAPTKVTMFFLLIILLGWISLNRLPINLFPDVRTPRITTEVRTEGLSPKEVERRVAQPLERALFTLRGVADVKSISRADTAILITEFTWDTPIDYAFLDVQKALGEAQRGNDDIQSVSVLRYDPNARPILTLALTAEKRMNAHELRQLATRVLEPQFERIEGVASVAVTGGEELELLVELDETRMLADGIEVSAVNQAIRNWNVNASGGWIEQGARRYLLKAVGEVSSLDEVGDIVVGRRGTTPIRLRELATLNYAPRERKSIVRLDGKPAVGMAFYKESLGNTVGVAKKVREEMEKIKKQLPPHVKLQVAQDQSLFIASAIGEVKSNAILGGVLAIVVLFFFLRDPRSVSIIALAIPISVVATFNLMYYLDLSLNLMTLGGLALGVGMLVDNAIVTLENIHRLHTDGHRAREAAVRGSREVAGALIASTLTTVVVFLPIVYVHGVAGLLFKEQALTVSFSLLASLVVALLLVPLLAYWLYHASEKLALGGAGAVDPKAPSPGPLAEASTETGESAGETPPPPPGPPRRRHFFVRAYEVLLRWTLRHRILVFVSSVTLLALAVDVALRIPQEFFPKTPQKQVRLRLTLPPSAPIGATDETVKVVEAYMKPLEPALEHVFVLIGDT